MNQIQILNTLLHDNQSSGAALPTIVFYIIVTIAVISASIVNYKRIIDLVEKQRKSRVAKLSEALKCEHITGLTKSHLEEDLATEHFKIATGVGREKAFREVLIQAHQATHGELDFIHFRQALPLLDYKDNKLTVKIDRFDLFGYRLNLFLGYVLAILGSLAIGLLISLLGIAFSSQFKVINIVQILSLLTQGASLIAFALLILKETFPVRSARKVAKELEKQRNNSAQPSAN